MKKWAFLAGVCLTGLGAMGAGAQDAGSDAESRRFTAERVFDIEYATSPQISPDGSKIVYVRHSMDQLKDRDRDRWSRAAHRPGLRPGRPMARNCSTPPPRLMVSQSFASTISTPARASPSPSSNMALAARNGRRMAPRSPFPCS